MFTDGGGGGKSDLVLAFKLTLSEISRVHVVCGTILGVLQTSEIGITSPFYKIHEVNIINYNNIHNIIIYTSPRNPTTLDPLGMENTACKSLFNSSACNPSNNATFFCTPFNENFAVRGEDMLILVYEYINYLLS